MILIVALFSFAQFFSQVVGLIGDEAVTSRETELQFLIDRLVFSEKKVKNVRTLNIDKSQFAREVNSTLVEMAVEREAHVFNIAEVDPADVKKLSQRFVDRIKGNMRWRYLDYSRGEVEAVIERKLRARQFLDFKKGSTIVPISDKEARDYYEKNRLRFGSLPYERFQSNIKRFLGTQRLNDRLQEWFGLLRKKYKIRNLISERPVENP